MKIITITKEEVKIFEDLDLKRKGILDLVSTIHKDKTEAWEVLYKKYNLNKKVNYTMDLKKRKIRPIK